MSDKDKRSGKVLIGLGIALLVGIVLSVVRFGLQEFAQGYFFGALLAISAAAGALAVRLVYALTGGRWAQPIMRYYVPASRALPLALLLWIPVLFWVHRLFPWASASLAAADPVIAHKASYLNVPFFVVRYVVYFVLWTGMVVWLDRFNARTDLSGFLSVVFFFVGSFAAMDWVMSLVPQWFSTIFAAAFVTGQVLFAFCAVIMVEGFAHPGLDRAAGQEVTGRVEPGGFIDQGSLILTMLLFYAYLAFSQFLIIWMGNKPKEISWYLVHLSDGWRFMPALIIVAHLFLPFFLLLRRSWKERAGYLAAVALIIVLLRAADIGWSVFTGFSLSAGTLTLTHAGAVILVLSVYCIVWTLFIRGYEGDRP